MLRHLAKRSLVFCDHHMRQRTGSGLPDFATAPFSLIPSEVLAIRELFGPKGLSSVEIDHPLVETPFATLPAMRLEVDRRLAGVIDAARVELGNSEWLR
jgi:hypothetical protein